MLTAGLGASNQAATMCGFLNAHEKELAPRRVADALEEAQEGMGRARGGKLSPIVRPARAFARPPSPCVELFLHVPAARDALRHHLHICWRLR